MRGMLQPTGKQAPRNNTPPNIPPTGGPSAGEIPVSGGRVFTSPAGDGAPRPRPPGKAMVGNTMAAPASGRPETSVSAEGARGDWAPSPATRHGVLGGRVVFADFGRGKVYALTDDGEDVSTFDSLVDMVERLSPAIVVVDSLPTRFQNNVAELAKKSIVFLRLKNPGKVSEERESDRVRKTDENDVKLLKTLYRRQPELFQPLFTSPEELEVRALTELWVELTRLKISAKRARTTNDNPVTAKAHKTLKRLIEELSKEIHEEALKLPLYRMVVDKLGLKGPTLAYLVSHDGWAFTTLPRDKLITRYGMTLFNRKRTLKRHLLIMLSNAAVLHKHPKYRCIYDHYRRKDKGHWGANLRVAVKILRDIHGLAQKAGGPPA